MSKLRVMPLYVEDLLSDAMIDRMDAATFGAYMRLLCYAWKEGGLPNDQERLRRLARVQSGMAWKRIWDVIGVKWSLDSRLIPGQYLVNAKQEAVRQSVNSHRIVQSNNAKARWAANATALPSGNASVSVSETVSDHNPQPPAGEDSQDQKPAPKKRKPPVPAMIADESLEPIEQKLVAYWRERCGVPRAHLSERDVRRLRECLANVALADEFGVTPPKLAGYAIKGCSMSAFHMGENDGRVKHVELSLIFRDPEHIRRFAEAAMQPAPQPFYETLS